MEVAIGRLVGNGFRHPTIRFQIISCVASFERNKRWDVIIIPTTTSEEGVLTKRGVRMCEVEAINLTPNYLI